MSSFSSFCTNYLLFGWLRTSCSNRFSNTNDEMELFSQLRKKVCLSKWKSAGDALTLTHPDACLHSFLGRCSVAWRVPDKNTQSKWNRLICIVGSSTWLLWTVCMHAFIQFKAQICMLSLLSSKHTAMKSWKIGVNLDLRVTNPWKSAFINHNHEILSHKISMKVSR